LVVTFFILGAIGYIGYFGLVVSVSRTKTGIQLSNAQVQASQAYQSLQQQAGEAQQQLQSCLRTTSPDSTVCSQNFDGQFGFAIGSYGAALEVIQFPSYASVQAAAAIAAASKAASLASYLETLAGIDSPAAYDQIMGSKATQAAFNAVDSTYEELQEALART
jgi:hypothetical protein